MDGVINGSLTIKRGTDQCVLDGDIMVEGTPLGQANASAKEIETPAPSAGASDVKAAMPCCAPGVATAADATAGETTESARQTVTAQ